MIERDYVVTDPKGIHATPSIALLNACSDYEVSVKLKYKGLSRPVEGVLSVLTRQIYSHHTFTLQVSGSSDERVEEFFRCIENHSLIGIRRRDGEPVHS